MVKFCSRHKVGVFRQKCQCSVEYVPADGAVLGLQIAQRDVGAASVKEQHIVPQRMVPFDSVTKVVGAIFCC